ncbi:NAD(P)/FAD-dependent oxidoreductase [Frankia sp. AgB32]|uniref:FAD-dependent oxidoreductase n=1 Tax=Frankia sp. AgB32 TaxID=631119 RepID=UPI00200CCEC5|nr:FAD-dependent monooxygenase [Frankia sp. AgB32]MCK9896222.1 FAD-dependent monooxygenase [Frankia sp. AgB32]
MITLTHGAGHAPAPRIVIVGGGLGGLTLARALHVRGLAAAVYELDAPPADAGGAPGHPLDLRAQVGLRALEIAGVPEPGPGVSRAELRRMLLAGLPADRVVWDAPVTAVRPAPGGGHLVELADGRAVPADLVVGADGTWSRVRRALVDVEPDYTGMFVFATHLSDVDRRCPALAAFVGGGVSAFAEDRGLVARRVGAGVAVEVALRVPAGWTELVPVQRRTAPALRDRLARHFTGWDYRLSALIRESDALPLARAVYRLPANLHWPRRPGVTLLGDAAHPGAPFADAGANAGMLDAAELAVALADRPGDVEAALRVYESALFARIGAVPAVR